MSPWGNCKEIAKLNTFWGNSNFLVHFNTCVSTQFLMWERRFHTFPPHYTIGSIWTISFRFYMDSYFFWVLYGLFLCGSMWTLSFGFYIYMGSCRLYALSVITVDIFLKIVHFIYKKILEVILSETLENSLSYAIFVILEKATVYYHTLT